MLHFPLVLMNRLNKTETAVFLYCRFSLFMKDQFFQIIYIKPPCGWGFLPFSAVVIMLFLVDCLLLFPSFVVDVCVCVWSWFCYI